MVCVPFHEVFKKGEYIYIYRLAVWRERERENGVHAQESRQVVDMRQTRKNCGYPAGVGRALILYVVTIQLVARWAFEKAATGGQCGLSAERERTTATVERW